MFYEQSALYLLCFVLDKNLGIHKQFLVITITCRLKNYSERRCHIGRCYYLPNHNLLNYDLANNNLLNYDLESLFRNFQVFIKLKIVFD